LYTSLAPGTEAGMGNEVKTVVLALVLQVALMVLVVGGAAVTTLYRERRLRLRSPISES